MSEQQRFSGTDRYIGRMFPLSLAGLDLAIGELRRPSSGTAALNGAGATLVTQSQPPQVS